MMLKVMHVFSAPQHRKLMCMGSINVLPEHTCLSILNWKFIAPCSTLVSCSLSPNWYFDRQNWDNPSPCTFAGWHFYLDSSSTHEAIKRLSITFNFALSIDAHISLHCGCIRRTKYVHNSIHYATFIPDAAVAAQIDKKSICGLRAINIAGRRYATHCQKL